MKAESPPSMFRSISKFSGMALTNLVGQPNTPPLSPPKLAGVQLASKEREPYPEPPESDVRRWHLGAVGRSRCGPR